MKSTVSNTPCKGSLPYPKLMVCKANSNLIMLMLSPTEGTCVARGASGWSIGEFSSSLKEENYYDFKGSVCLENSV